MNTKPHIRKVNGRWGYRSLTGRTDPDLAYLASYYCTKRNAAEGNPSARKPKE